MPKIDEIIFSVEIKGLPKIDIVKSNGQTRYTTYQNYTWGTSIQYPSIWYKEEGGYYFSDTPEIPSECFPNIISFAPTQNNLNNSTDIVSLRLNLISAAIPHSLGGTKL